MKLHLGCGKRNFGDGWYHIDQTRYPHTVGKVIYPLGYKDNSADIIYSSHVLEYFDREEVVNVLRDWYRVLKPGGIIRLAVPDFSQLARLYLEKGLKLDRILGPLYGKMGNPPFYHKTTYDLEDLTQLLFDCGFNQVRRYDWRDTEHAHIDDHSQAYYPHMDKENGILISLNVEAIK